MSDPALTESSPVTIALIQAACGPDPADNLDRTVATCRAASQAGTHIICLQELFHLRYPCRTEDHAQFALAEPIPGPTLARLQQVAAECSCVLVGALFERRGPGVYHNSAVVIDADGTYLGCYRKMHIPDDPGYYEKFYFAPGDLGFRCFTTRYARIGVGICWDQWFPEAARALALAGAQILFYPTAIGWLADETSAFGPSQYDAWQTMLRSHAIANGLFVAAPNRVGIEGQLEFWGGSVIVDPYGNVVQRGSHQQPEIVTAPCDLQLVDTARTHWPFLRDRRVDAYADLQHRWVD